MQIRRTRLLLAATVLTVAALAPASPTSLFLMPIADILKHREAFAYAGFQGYEGRVSKSYDPYNTVTVGLFDRVEVGFDNDFREVWTGCAKLQLYERGKAALSVGATGWSGKAVDPFSVGRLDGSVQFLSGPGGHAWAALFYAVLQVVGLGVQVVAGASSDPELGVQHAACLYYAFKL